jgi:lysophospholipase L1-like esterase
MQKSWFSRRFLIRLFLIPAVMLLLVEIGSRIFVCHIASDELFSYLGSVRQYENWRKGRLRFTFHPYLGYVPTPGFQRGKTSINRHGCRGEDFVIPKPAGEFRIACMGGSTTFDDCIEEDAQAWPAQLEAMLRQKGYAVRVINAGVPGWSSYESLINYTYRVSYYEPDLIIPMHVWNDLSIRLVHPPEYYRSDNTGAKAPQVMAFPWWESSTALRTMLVAAGLTPPHLPLLCFNPAPTMFQGTPDDPIIADMPFRDLLKKNPPVYFMKNMKHLIALAQSGGTECLLLTMPFSRDISASVYCFGIAPGETGVHGIILDAFDEMNAAVIQVSRQSGVPCCDLAREYPQPENFRELFDDGFHNNAAGAAVKAELVARYLIENAMIPVEFQHLDSE